MSFLKELVDTISSIFNNQKPSSSYPSPRNPDGRSMDGVITGNERTAYKLKSYFDFATEEIAKAVRAEEWGLAEDAVSYYQNAQKVLSEGISTPVPSYITSSELEKAKSYRQKMTQWQGQVAERIQTLRKRAGISGSSSVIKSGGSQVQSVSAVSHTSSYSRKPAVEKPSGSNKQKHDVKIQSKKVGSSIPVQDPGGGGYDSKLTEMINSVIVDRSPSVKWEDIGLLLFGPPGTGKTLLAKAVASESQATFFNVSASSLTSKWVGEGEKLVRTLFSVAISRQPSVIFMDEIDSIMSTRTTNENEASRRLKSEFLIQFDGVTCNSDDLVIVIGATNKPHELDDAVLRRLVKRIYIPLPDAGVRRELLKHRLKGQQFSLPDGDITRLVRETEGYSGSDLQALCEEAAMMPIRELGSDILTVNANQVRGLRYADFQKAMTVIRPSLQKCKWEDLERWNQEFGSN
ncbi:unnamed protein product [Cuscuta epithymum]|uniref:microtubule-severing ATPase n=1 Tax=Cuscuta epithymum TaxID=186058 RepID=A0AAV0D9Q6_9ASTE|nr:unnamed protein product [Cuscuta epithymum]